MKKSSRDRRKQTRLDKGYFVGKNSIIFKKTTTTNTLQYDGSKIPNAFLILQEQQMWDDIAKARRENPWLGRIKTKGDDIVGKAVFTSTVDEGEGAYRSMWVDGDETKESGLQHFFIPSSELYKK